ncbi:MAG: DNA repair protein RadA, partial [Polyangiaceae bacterium]|nr:DNA repair protein RadA [Polyangiaceae bacterium]
MTKTKRAKSAYVCQACGHGSPRWMGRCPGCGEWSSLVEELVPAGNSSRAAP